jgi:hypothetical protein
LQAFRRLYEEVGLGWVYAVTKYEPVSAHFQCKSKDQLVSFISESYCSAAHHIMEHLLFVHQTEELWNQIVVLMWLT